MTPQARTAAVRQPLPMAAAGRRDQRADRRYVLARPMTGALEHAFERHQGRVLNISRQGFLLHVPRLAAHQLAADGTVDFGEIIQGVRSFGGFGRIAHVENRDDGVRIGFEWDSYVLSRRDAVIDELIRQVVGAAGPGRLSRQGDRLILSGHVSSALAMEVHAAHQAGARSISLLECSSIDSGGLALLRHLAGLGVQMVDSSPEIAELLD